MAFCLFDHPKRYDLDLEDSSIVFFSGFTALPYAYRHFTLINKKAYLGHLVLGLFECIPFLGGIIGLIEKVAFHCFGLHKQIAMEKMLRNSVKALTEHRNKRESEPYAPQACLPTFKSLLHCKSLPLFKMSYTIAQHLGNRTDMQDEFLVQEFDHGYLMGIFDGHCGGQVAAYCKQNMSDLFVRIFASTNNDISRTFALLAGELHHNVSQRKEWDDIGTTALMTYVDKRTHLIFTATIGDSEANIYRKTETGNIVSIPLSCVRDWGCMKDAQRAAKATQAPEIVFRWTSRTQSKTLRYRRLNVSRSIGDASKHPPMTHKPKITVNRLLQGDVLVLTSDGLKDFRTEYQIVLELTTLKGNANIAAALCNLALSNPHLKDNLTILAFSLIYTQ